jgi:hypothetical protein
VAADPLLLAALQRFGTSLTANFGVSAANPAQPEDQLKPPLADLLTTAGSAFGVGVIPRTEALGGIGVRPDVGVTVNGLLAGHIELKAPGKGARPGGILRRTRPGAVQEAQ